MELLSAATARHRQARTPSKFLPTRLLPIPATKESYRTEATLLRDFRVPSWGDRKCARITGALPGCSLRAGFLSPDLPVRPPRRPAVCAISRAASITRTTASSATLRQARVPPAIHRAADALPYVDQVNTSVTDIPARLAGGPGGRGNNPRISSFRDSGTAAKHRYAKSDGICPPLSVS
jgi:hypothetical protein